MGFAQADVDILVELVRQPPPPARHRHAARPRRPDHHRSGGRRRGETASTLHLLAALTEADSRATGPSAWGAWKAGLVADLVDRTDRLLQGEEAGPAADGRMVEANRSLMDEVRATGQPAVSLQPPQVIVAAPDRRGLFSSVTGALALNGLDVRAANASGEDGVAVEVFTVEVARGTWPDTAKLREDLAAVLSDRMALGERLSDASGRTHRSDPPRPASRHPRCASTTTPQRRRPSSKCMPPTRSVSCTGSPVPSSTPASTWSPPASRPWATW